MELLLWKRREGAAGSVVYERAAWYAVGSLWVVAVSPASPGPVGILTLLCWCVFPFIIRDIAKIALALILTKRLSGVIRR